TTPQVCANFLACGPRRSSRPGWKSAASTGTGGWLAWMKGQEIACSGMFRAYWKDKLPSVHSPPFTAEHGKTNVTRRKRRAKLSGGSAMRIALTILAIVGLSSNAVADPAKPPFYPDKANLLVYLDPDGKPIP